MLNRTTLDPETRVLYGDSLQPPPGYVFDAAVATTFSLDFETALAAPVSLALFAAENRDDILSHPLALLEGAERIAGRLVVFSDAGHLHAQGRPHSRLCSLLERIIVEVAAPRGGAFHPPFSVGDSYDNALAETINGLYKAEVIWRQRSWPSASAVEMATLRWVDWFNNHRLFGPIGHIPPAEAEANYYAARGTLDMVA